MPKFTPLTAGWNSTGSEKSVTGAASLNPTLFCTDVDPCRGR
jgi:hypothetical protein